jgi:tRNA-2-methylthio-N6-dimethylallyladenosine synthase
MKRAYTRRRYLEKVQMVREAIPDVAVSTDIIVGFPGETEDDFEATLDVVSEARYDSSYMFQYSPRPMTPAAELPDQVPKEVVQNRFDRLVELQRRLSLESNRRMIGRTEEVIVEGTSKKDETRLTGRTRTNKVVHFGSEQVGEGTFVTVRVTGAGAHHLDGEVVGTTHRDARPELTLPLLSAGSGCSSCA